ncbi:MAG TPA: 30S ribosomal protein S20 [Flavobacteriales bacterium]|nr:30S ribosomal protein S20 [Flavobacteriales bacterium]
MANHKSAEKRIRGNETKRVNNKYYHKTARTFLKKVRTSKDKKEAEVLVPKVYAMLDKLAKRGIIHANKAANLKSGVKLHVNSL